MNRKLKLTLLILAAAVVLAGAAYLAMLYVFPGSNVLRSLGLPGAGGKQQVRIEVQRSPELPPNDPDAEGTITAQQNNSLTVSQDNCDENSCTNGAASVEVVLTHDTQIYRDATLDNTSKAQIIQGGSRTLTMIVQPMAVTDIAVGDILQAWGEKRGDRLNATAVLVMKNIQNAVPAMGGK